MQVHNHLDDTSQGTQILAENGIPIWGVMAVSFEHLVIGIERGRSMLPSSALDMIDALPDLLRNDPTEQLLLEATVVSSQRDECLRAVDAYFAQSRSVRSAEQCKTLAQWEYLTRQMVIAYERELMARMAKVNEEADDGR